jgi:hypothetical protein
LKNTFLTASFSNKSTFFFLWRCDPTRVMVSLFTRFLDHTQQRTTVCRTPLDEWSARRRDLYLTIHNRQISMPPVRFEPTISNRRAAADLLLRPRGHWDRQNQPTRCNNFSSLLLDVCVQLNMFRAPSRPSLGAQQLQ